MKWANYETDVVCKYGYEIIGWPADNPITKSVDNLSIPVLDRIIDGFNDGTIYWEEVPQEELAIRRRNAPRKTRASRSDKGKRKRAPSGSGAENERPRASSKKHRSASVVNTSDEEENSS